MKPKPAAPATAEEQANEAQALADIAAWAVVVEGWVQVGS